MQKIRLRSGASASDKKRHFAPRHRTQGSASTADRDITELGGNAVHRFCLGQQRVHQRFGAVAADRQRQGVIDQGRCALWIGGAVFWQGLEALAVHATHRQCHALVRVDRQAWIADTFQKGKTNFEAGHFKEAVEFWQSITPYLEDGSNIKSLIGVVKASELQLQDAQKEAGDAEARKDGKFASPTDLVKMLNDSADQLKKQAFEFNTSKEKAEQ